MAHKYFRTELCVFAAPDTRSALHARFHCLKLPKDIYTICSIQCVNGTCVFCIMLKCVFCQQL